MTAPGWRAGAPVLRLGIAGGRNTINAENIRAFLAVAREHLRRTLLPVEFVIAGSVCDLVSDLASPWVTLLGSVATMDELYGQVDAVLAPLAFSTGLKIKVGEALSRGKAVIGHAHAFEGYRVAHPFQACEDFTAILRAIHAIAREPSLLDALEDASRETIARARQRLDRAVAHSGARARARRRSVAIVADTATLRPDSLVFDHLREAAAVLGASAVLEFRLIGDPALADAGCLRQLARHGPIRSGDDAADTVLRDTDAVLFAAIPDPLPADGLALGAAHLDVLALSASGAELTARLPALARGCGEFRLLGQDRSALAARILAAAADGPDPGRVRHIAAPFLAQNHESPLLRALHRAPADGVAVLAERGGAPELLAVLAFLVHGLRLRPTLYAADGIAPAFPPDGILALPAGALLRAAPRALFSPATYRLTRPRFVVEIGAAPGFAAAREVFSRSHIPMARLFDPLAPEEAMLRAEACARSRLPVSALLTLDHLAREADRFAPALGAEAERERGGQAGWGALLGMIAAGHGAG